MSSLSKDVASAPGTWVETPLETPLQLSAGTRYRLGAYSGGGMHHLSIAAPALFAHGTIDQSYATAGDTFPNRSDGAHWWLVDLRYVPGSTEIESRGPCRKGLLGQESAEVQTGCSQGQTQIKIKD